MSTEPQESAESSGVQELIDRLHDEGIAKGREEADELLSSARQKAAEILEAAKKEAAEIVSQAQEESERTRVGGEEALRLASRDAILTMTEHLQEDFVRQVRVLVGHAMHDTEFLRRLIL